MTSPTWPRRREIYIDARDLRSDSDPDEPLPPEAYAAVLTTRGRESWQNTSSCKLFRPSCATEALPIPWEMIITWEIPSPSSTTA